MSNASSGVACFVLACLLLSSPLLAATGDSFSFVVIADPHVSGGAGSEYAQMLLQAVDWVNNHREQENIDLVFAVGDIGWGGGMSVAKSILDGLAVPYAPILGDDEVAAGDEVPFHDTYTPTWQSLDALASNPDSGLSNWQKAPGPVSNPEVGGLSYLQNFAFDYHGVHFMALDWVPRDMSGRVNEEAEIHDFEGGTFPWFTDYIANCSKDKQENVVMLGHHPMFTLGGYFGEILASLGAFSPPEFEQISDFLNDPNHSYRDYVANYYGGHYHYPGYLAESGDPNTFEMTLPGGYTFDPNDYDPNGPIQLLPLPGYDLYVVDDTHSDGVHLELITVTEGETAFTYDSRRILVPEPAFLGPLGFLTFLTWLRRAR
ncbi:MAG: metallophosphoesterase [Phycisphaerae bacterium]|nr:metallophosphoesterase [Phycisphaerae bacterium]